MTMTEKFCLKRLKSSSTCQQFLYRVMISSPLHPAPRDIRTTAHPTQNSVSVVICRCFLEAFPFLHFLAFSTCLFESFRAITRTTSDLFLYLQKQKHPLIPCVFPLFFSADVSVKSSRHLHHISGKFLGLCAGSHLHSAFVHKSNSTPCHTRHLQLPDPLFPERNGLEILQYVYL